jgi:hypothetical protein
VVRGAKNKTDNQDKGQTRGGPRKAGEVAVHTPATETYLCGRCSKQERSEAGTAPADWPWSWVNPDVVPQLSSDDQEVQEAVRGALQLLKEVRDRLEQLLHGDSIPAPPLYHCIHVGLTGYLWFGGSAGYLKHRTGYAVAVESGSSLQILLALFRLAHHPLAFKKYRTAVCPSLTKPIALPVIAYGPNGLERIGDGDTKALPAVSDPKLNSVLRLLHSHALTFLFLHEVSHVLCGHIEFCATVKKTSNTNVQ